MRVFLDENIHSAVKRILFAFEVDTCGDCGWLGTLNGELLRRISEAGFDVLITRDQSMPFQQRMERMPFGTVVVRVRRNRAEEFAAISPQLEEAIRSIKAGQVV